MFFFHLLSSLLCTFDNLVEHFGLFFTVSNPFDGLHLPLPLAPQALGHFGQIYDALERLLFDKI